MKGYQNKTIQHNFLSKDRSTNNIKRTQANKRKEIYYKNFIISLSRLNVYTFSQISFLYRFSSHQGQQGKQLTAGSEKSSFPLSLKHLPI